MGALFPVMGSLVDLALLRGFSAIVSGRSSYEAKIEMGHKLVPLNNYCRHRNIFLHNVYRIFAHQPLGPDGRGPDSASRGAEARAPGIEHPLNRAPEKTSEAPSCCQ